jgi:poly(3-hydroxybutyrate) depolymerase
MPNFRDIENLFIYEVLPEEGLQLDYFIDVDDEFFSLNEIINVNGVADGLSVTSAAAGASAAAAGLADGFANTSAQGAASASVSGSANGQATTSAQVEGLGGSTWTKYPYTSMSTNVDGYWVYMPAGAGPQSACIISFHGLGEQGDGGPTDLDKVITQGFAKLVNDRMNTGAEFPYDCICIFPQYIGTPLSGFFFQNVINYVKANFTFDESKLHITGYSNGAACVVNWWEVGTLSDVASCSIVSTSLGYSGSAAARLVAARMPVLLNHGTLDSGFTAYQKSVDWRDGLNALNISPPAVLDDMPDEGHNVDETVYDWTWYNPVSGLTQLQWHQQYQRVPGTDTSGSASGGSTTSAIPQARAAAAAAANGVASTSGVPAAKANTSGAAQGSSQAEINVGVDNKYTSGSADGSSSASANAGANAETTGDGDGSAQTQGQAAAVQNTSGFADGVSSGNAYPQAIIIIPQVITVKSRIKPIFSRESEIDSTINLSSKI